MTRLQQKREDRKTFYALIHAQPVTGSGGSWYEATEVVKQRIAWLEHMPESEPTRDHQEAILKACRDFYETVQPLVAHYIDGEELPK